MSARRIRDPKVERLLYERALAQKAHGKGFLRDYELDRILKLFNVNDYGDLPSTSVVLDQKTITAQTATGSATGWQDYTAPLNAKMLLVTACGGGGGARGGQTGASNTTRAGGGGGGSGGMTRLFIPLLFTRATIYCMPGKGGTGGGAGANGNNGNSSFVGVQPNSTNVADLLSTANPGSGSVGTGGAAGGAAVANTAAMAFNAPGAFFQSSGGGAGTAGGTGAAGTNLAIAGSAASWVQGGTGAGGPNSTPTDFKGGDITGVTGSWPTLAGGVAAAGDGNHGIGWGLSGFAIEDPQMITVLMGAGAFPVFYGGTGGGTAGAAGTGGRGGNGFWGCGAGGGGGGVTGGTGGNGGDGFIHILAL